MINPRELEVLNIIAGSKEPMTSSQIVNAGNMLSQSTVQTVLRKLLKAKLVEVDNVVHSGNVLSRTYTHSKECKAAVLKEFTEYYQGIQHIASKQEAIAALGGRMTADEFARSVVTMLQYEKDNFVELIENEDWDSLEDEICEYIAQCD